MIELVAAVDSDGNAARTTATLLAAIIGALAAIVSAIISGINATKSRHWIGRDQWWQRFSWAIEKSISGDEHESELGLSVLLAIVDVKWAKPEDNEMALAVADVIAHRSGSTRHPRGRRR